MKYMLDTNICIYLINNRPTTVKRNLEKISPSDVCVSSITASELWYGVTKSKHVEKNTIALIKFFSKIEVLSYDEEASIKFGEIRASLEKKGNIIGAYDLMIAAHALSLNYTLVTNNGKEFKRIKNLKIKNWV